MSVMTFFCSICEQESNRICVKCTKDTCSNHLCEKCARCSDCCDCAIRLNAFGPKEEPLPHAHPMPDPDVPEPPGHAASAASSSAVEETLPGSRFDD